MRGTRAGRGFTLVEILVVLGILAVLAGIAFPVFLRARASGRNAVCITQLGGIAKAARMYADDNDRTLVPARTAVTVFGTKGLTWCVLLQPYLGGEKILLCPEDRSPQLASSSTDYPHSYGINYTLAYNTLFGSYPFVLSLGQVPRTSDVVLFFEITPSSQAMGSAYTSNGISRIDPRHNGRGNFAFLDGHVKGYRPAQMRNLAYWDPFVNSGS